jgi:rhodanese-related sulfurtransferase
MFRTITRFLAPTVLFIVCCSVFSLAQTDKGTTSSTLQATTEPAAYAITSDGTESIVFLRHGEKPKHGLGQLTPQGLNRSLALASLLPKKIGKPDYIFAPDPIEKVDGGGAGNYFYVRPLATIEPTAIALEMPWQTPFGERQIDKLNDELTKSKYSRSLTVGLDRVNLADVRSHEEFTGEVEAPAGLAQAVKPSGHIPGARNIPWAKAANDDGTFKDTDQLRKLFKSNGVDRGRPTIAYCGNGGGERSSHTWFVLKYLLAYPSVKNFDGLWTESGNAVGARIHPRAATGAAHQPCRA